MDKLSLRPFHSPSVSFSDFQENIEQSILPKPHGVSIEEDGLGRSRQFEFSPQRESVGVLLFHRKKQRFMVLRQFRPAVFVSRVLQLSDNEGMDVAEIDWSSTDRAVGCTVELCCGHVRDRKKNIDETALAIVEEEFGFKIERKYLQHIETFVTGLSHSGAPYHLYYAELDKAHIVGEGRIAKRDAVHRVWLSMTLAEDLCKRNTDPLVSSLHFYAFMWWFQTKHYTARAKTMEETNLFGLDMLSALTDRVQYDKDKRTVVPFRGLRCTVESTVPSRYPPLRMKYQIMGLDKTWEMAAGRPDTVSILIKDYDSKELVMVEKFRPATLVGRVMALPENEGKSITDIDFSAYPGVWAYTMELASGRVRRGETVEDSVMRISEIKLGYRIRPSELKFIAKLVVGSSASGESKYVYYAECKKCDRIEEWKTREEEARVKMDRWKAVTELKPRHCTPSLLVAKAWLLWNERRPSKAEVDAEIIAERDAQRREFEAIEWARRAEEERRREREEEEHAARLAAWCARERAKEAEEAARREREERREEEGKEDEDGLNEEEVKEEDAEKDRSEARKRGAEVMEGEEGGVSEAKRRIVEEE